jgi:alkanesulfonate monooxygenase SsuD/methylene tetrahydromethanopterin reductase-like flavin-dependent oxidoreductase (luciferase family)
MKIGLMLPLVENETIGFDHLRALAVAAEEGGLDSVWGADHLIFREDGETHGIHECWTVLTALAAVTSRVEIGPLVLAVPFRNPALIAKMAVELDEVSHGRLILGLGCGWHEPEFSAFGYPFDHRVSRFDEAMQIIVPLLREGRVTFEGRYHRAVDAELKPRGPRPSGPPILVAGKGPRMLSLVARDADQWNGAWYGDPVDAHELDARLRNLDAALVESGRDPATLTLTAGIFVVVPSLLTDGDDPPERAIRGDTETVARALAGYADRRIAHLIAHVWPRTPAAVTELGRAAALAREMVPAHL